MDYKTIRINIEKKVAFLRFNRPDQLNAMNRQMMDEIIAGINEVNANNEVWVGVITGEGRAFMAGADIKEYGAQTTKEFEEFQLKGMSLYRSLEEASKPWIAAVNGFALGGGFEIALACDMILAAESAKMGLPEVFLSLVSGGGGTQRLIQRTGINRAKEILFTGKQYRSDKFLEWGIVNRVYKDKVFMEEVTLFAGMLSRRPRQAVQQLKRLVHLSLDPIFFEDRIKEEGNVVSKLFKTKEAQSSIQDFIDRTENS